MTREINLNEIEGYIKALHCPIRWDIIRVINEEPKTSEQIYEILKNIDNKKLVKSENCKGKCFHSHHKNLKKPTLYYHLRELESAGLIEGNKMVDKEGSISKEKQWELTIESLKINFKD
ncbi:MAG: helix-turn-helix domain-containing protein [Candidatus Lokiarchaeota archaeon]|nr:helix-turn-helix domain-containing protein [Candidatus Lokiarchaeota archaeon]MBD3199263.1 helix-turn-helix domain-containing protein [Candidatus Lokiarchaeota archaeon]